MNFNFSNNKSIQLPPDVLQNSFPKTLNARTLKLWQRVCLANTMDFVWSLGPMAEGDKLMKAFNYYATSVDVIMAKYGDLMPKNLVEQREYMMRATFSLKKSDNMLTPEKLWSTWSSSNKIVVNNMLPLWLDIAPKKLASGKQHWGEYVQLFREKYREQCSGDDDSEEVATAVNGEEDDEEVNTGAENPSKVVGLSYFLLEFILILINCHIEKEKASIY